MTPQDIQRRLDTIFNSWDEYPGRAPGGTGKTGLAANDATGWSRMLEEQTEATNLQRRQQGQGPVTVREGGGSAMSRPSLDELQRAGMDDTSQRRRKANEVNSGVDPTFEQRREAGILGDMDARASRGLEDERRRNETNFDLGSGAARAREREIGDIESEHAQRQARTKNDIYFQPDERRRREDEFSTEMERLRRRYTDPALVNAQAKLDAERVRAAGGVEREGVRGTNDIGRQTLINQGNESTTDTKANATIGAAVARQGGDPTKFQPATGAPGAGGKTYTMDELRSFATDNKMSVQEALGIFATNGYRLAR